MMANLFAMRSFKTVRSTHRVVVACLFVLESILNHRFHSESSSKEEEAAEVEDNDQVVVVDIEEPPPRSLM